MGWFSDQIHTRKQSDAEFFSSSLENVANAVMGKRIYGALNDDKYITQNAMNAILRYYHVKNREIPDGISDINERLEYLLRPNGIMRRTVKLEEGWYKDAVGAMLGIKKDDGSVVALIPTGFSGYSYYDIATEKFVKISKKNEALFEEEAYSFYKPFPLKKLSIASLFKYTLDIISPADFVMIAVLTLLVSLVGLFSPKITKIVFSDVAESGSIRLLLAITTFSVCVSVSMFLITIVKNFAVSRLNTKINVNVEAAVMMRVMSLPATFFKSYSSGDLMKRVGGIKTICRVFISTVMSTGLTSLFSFIYIFQIIGYAPSLVWPALIFTILSIAFTIASAFVQSKRERKIMDLEGRDSGMVYSMIGGIQKIKLSGAEKRVFARWENTYADYIRLKYDLPIFLKINSVISMAITLTGEIVMYYYAVKSGVSISDYYAFNTAYGMVSGALVALSGITVTISTIKPILERIKPIMDEIPEISEGKEVLTKLNGNIELNNISFRYEENTPYILDNLTLKIKSGQYIAIVGKTGCGKSTLIRLLLGFEKAQKGAIYYDGKDISKIEPKSLRRKIGTVMQNGKLFQGDIYSNITISAPWLTVNDAWEAAELAGIAEDIRHMPMGMHTLISEGSGGISGGQRQRLMIARAIAPKPKILIFDEATSALDNITQKKVSDSLDSLKCTRIVVAHRLSTIKHCDRIIVLDQGKIVEDGTYEELIAENGFFAELVERQRLDSEK